MNINREQTIIKLFTQQIVHWQRVMSAAADNIATKNRFPVGLQHDCIENDENWLATVTGNNEQRQIF